MASVLNLKIVTKNKSPLHSSRSSENEQKKIAVIVKAVWASLALMTCLALCCFAGVVTATQIGPQLFQTLSILLFVLGLPAPLLALLYAFTKVLLAFERWQWIGFVLSAVVHELLIHTFKASTTFHRLLCLFTITYICYHRVLLSGDPLHLVKAIGLEFIRTALHFLLEDELPNAIAIWFLIVSIVAGFSLVFDHGVHFPEVNSTMERILELLDLATIPENEMTAVVDAGDDGGAGPAGGAQL